MAGNKMMRVSIALKVAYKMGYRSWIGINKFLSKSETEKKEWRNSFLLKEYYSGASLDWLMKEYKLSRASIYYIIRSRRRIAK